MNCKDFEMLMADALGDELVPTDRPAFEAHLAKCERCRREYETARRAVETMCSLPGPRRVDVRREGNRLVIEDNSRRARTPHRLSAFGGATRAVGSVFRYAASLLIAFAGGYALHAGLMVVDAGRRSEPIVGVSAATSPSLRGSLVSTHVRNPTRSDLAKCLIAMSRAKR